MIIQAGGHEFLKVEPEALRLLTSQAMVRSTPRVVISIRPPPDPSNSANGKQTNQPPINE